MASMLDLRILQVQAEVLGGVLLLWHVDICPSSVGEETVLPLIPVASSRRHSKWAGLSLGSQRLVPVLVYRRRLKCRSFAGNCGALKCGFTGPGVGPGVGPS